MVTRLIMVTGMSGAGKSTAMSILEDLGYHCIDQFPAELVKPLIEILKDKNRERYSELALSTTLDEFPKIIEQLKSQKIPYEVLFLVAGEKQILTRYKFTRHLHPLIASGQAKTLASAIKKERVMYEKLAQDDTAVYLNTDNLTYQDLKKRLDQEYTLNIKNDFSITFEAFGYKFGIPQDADFILDVRPLPNPYWVPELRNQTGNDEPVYRYVIDNQRSKTYLKRLVSYLDEVFRLYAKEGRNHLIVAIGCTGGQHRSVSVANYLYKHYVDKYHCFKELRDENKRK